ncbi:hypothetical protein MKX01_029871 [Papaver californicum]|nr:hypothetical protein MKX01_029871 [Papaver californicum]
MSLSSSDTDMNKRLGKRQLTSKAVQEERLINDDDDAHPKASKRLSITDLPDDCLSLVYQSLESSSDHSSFGLVCRHWLRIQNNNHESLWDIDDYKCSLRKSPKVGPESFSTILSKLLIRFQHLKRLSLTGLPEVTDYVTSQSQFLGSKVQFPCLKYFSAHNSDKKVPLIFSLFRRLATVRLSGSNINDEGLEVLAKCCASLEKVDLKDCKRITDTGLEVLAKSCASLKKVDLSYCQQITDKGLEVLAICCASLEKIGLENCHEITDKGLEVLAKCCASLEKVNLTDCQGITDSGISFIIQNCSEIHSLQISYCDNVTGIGFLGCPETLTTVDATHMYKLTTEGIKAIASGGGIEYLSLSGNAVNNEAVITISKCCPLLKSLNLVCCHNVKFRGWKAIGLYCRNLEGLYVTDCSNLYDSGFKALCYGCNKVSFLFVDRLSDFALEHLKRERPDVCICTCPR